ncbi:MAG TPA: transcription termination factor Rho [Euzebya sp.]|nr:transcription termination factor Rho [Euzebya sp.]
MDRSVLARKPMTELRDIASHLNMRSYQKLRKAELIDAIVSSGSDEADRPAGGQQRLVEGSQGDAEADRDAREERAREESARKVLPPAARQPDDVVAATDRGADRQDTGGVDPAEDASVEAAADVDDDRGRDRDRNEGQGQRTRPQGRDGEQSRDRHRTRTRGEEPQAAEVDAASGSGAQDDDDDDDSADRKRRNRRDRRKRNRDRQGEDPTPTPTAQQPPSGTDPGEVRAGVLDILPEGYGFLRTTGYLPGERDVYVSQGQIRKHGLRRGDVVQGPIRQQRSNEKVPALHHVQRVNGDELEDGQVAERPDFDALTPIHPEERLSLGGADAPLAARLVDLLAPLGRGQRALVTAPPRAGKSTLLRELGLALAKASPDSHLMAVLVDERPEDISEMIRTFPGEVIASPFDKAAEDHTQIAELALERARRLVELGHDVILLLDSLTRLTRAYGVTVPAVGRTIAPGIEAASLYPAKRFFAAARNLEEGGSLTVMATALSDTTSAIDRVILEEFLRVANTVIILDAELTRRHVHPPISVFESGTDNEAALQDADDLVIIQSLRRALGEVSDGRATELLLDKLAQTDSADQLLAQIRDISL